MRAPIAAALLAACCLMSSCARHLPAMNDEQPVPRPQQIVSFDPLYGQNCSACHGSNGQNGPALDLNNPVFQQLMDDATLHRAIRDGVPGTQMPAFGESAGGMLTEPQVDALVAGMRKRWATEGTTRPAQIPSVTTTLTGNAAHGQQLFATDCRSCHSGKQQQVTDPTYLALVSDQALRILLIAGRPDLGHPGSQTGWQTVANGHAASDQDVTDLVAYLASLRSATPGQPYPGTADGVAQAVSNDPARTRLSAQPTTQSRTEK